MKNLADLADLANLAVSVDLCPTMLIDHINRTYGEGRAQEFSMIGHGGFGEWCHHALF